MTTFSIPWDSSPAHWAALLFAACIGALSLATSLAETTTSRGDAAVSGEIYISPALLIADVIGGSLCCLALWLRRSRPVGVALFIAPVAIFSTLATGAAIVAVFGLAVRRPIRTVAPIVALFVATVPAYLLIRPEVELEEAVITPFAIAAVVG